MSVPYETTFTFNDGTSNISVTTATISSDSYKKNKSGLVSAVIGTSCTEFSREAFRDCSNLKSVTIPNSVTNLGYQTFQKCIKF